MIMEFTEKDYTFPYVQDKFTVTQQMKDIFDKQGFIIVRSVLGDEEIGKLKTAVENENGVIEHSYGRDDGHGRRTRISLWDNPGNDVTGLLSRCEKVAGTMEQLLGGEVYRYHSKLIMKDAKTGGAHLWHQDYGYWYQYGCLFPDMGSVMIALDKCTPENGSLQVLPGSHLAGRIDHVKCGGQLTADGERVKHVENQIKRVHANLNPGDALFFHCNLLHTSSQNHSDMRRWVFIISYNRSSNNPVFDSHHPKYSPLQKVGNDAIKTCTNLSDMTGKSFYHPQDDNLAMRLPGLDRH